METIQYKGYTIHQDFIHSHYSAHPEYILYPTNEGIQHDADGGPDGYKYCGNCKWFTSIEECKDEIDELTYSEVGHEAKEFEV